MKKEILKKEGIHAFFDACTEPYNPGGNMGIGAVIYSDGVEEYTFSDFHPAKPSNSNNVAEYLAFEHLVDHFLQYDLPASTQILINGDSKLVVQQMNGVWRIKEGLYVKYAKRILPKWEKLRNKCFVQLKWISRDFNDYADRLSKGQLIERGVQFRIQPLKLNPQQ